MRLLFLFSVIIAVVCQLGDAAYKRGPNSFYGLRRMPRFNRRLIPSRFYPNLYYKPVFYPPRHQRVYRSAPAPIKEGEEAVEMQHHEEVQHPEEEMMHHEVVGEHHVEAEERPGHKSDVRKRSVGKKLAHLPKWKTDIILNLFGRGSSDHHNIISHFEDFSSEFRGQDRSLEVDELLDEVLTSPNEGGEEVLDESFLEEDIDDDDGEPLVEEELDVDSASQDSEDMVEEVMEPSEEEVVEEEVETEEEESVDEDKTAATSRRRRNAIENDMGEDDKKKKDKKVQKRGAISPYLVDEEVEEQQQEFTEVSSFGNQGGGFFPNNNGGGFVEQQQEEIVFDEEETTYGGYQPVKRSVYGDESSDDSFPSSNVHLSPRFSKQPRRKASKKPRMKPRTFSSPRNIVESSPSSSLPDGYSQ